MHYWLLMLLFLLQVFLVESVSPSRESSPDIDYDSVLNLLSDEDLASLHYHKSSTPATSSDQHHALPPQQVTDHKAKRREYMKSYYQKTIQQNPNYGKEKYKRRVEILSQKTEEERRKNKDKRSLISRNGYHRRKITLGHGRKKLQDMQQIKQKIIDNTATPQEKSEYHDFAARKRRICEKSRMKKAIREHSQQEKSHPHTKDS